LTFYCLFSILCIYENIYKEKCPAPAENTEDKEAAMAEHLTKEQFLNKVFDYENEQDWNFKGDLPCIIDFYADWCGPCKMVAPVLEELSEEYQGKMNVYKIDTEAEQELAGAFGIQSIPSLLFIPKEGKPQMAQGALPKDGFLSAMKDVLGVE
jgi:thioredoxin 1